MVMSDSRRQMLEYAYAFLTEDEIAGGYHFCAEFDYIMVGPDDWEWDVCICQAKNRYIENNPPVD